MLLRQPRAELLVFRARTNPSPRYGDPERALVADLRAAGADVRTVWELAAAKWYPVAVADVLVSHLRRTSDPYVVRGIARALTAPFAPARAYAALLAKLASLRKCGALKDPDVARALGAAIAKHARPRDFEELFACVRDPACEEARIPLLYRILGWNIACVAPKLMPLLADAQLRPTIVRALGRLRYEPALPCIETLLSSPDATERGAAQRALRDFVRAPNRDADS